MAKMRNPNVVFTEGLTNDNCPPDFVNPPKALSDYVEADTRMLARSCANFKALISHPDALLDNAGQLIRAAYFSLQDLGEAARANTGGEYVRLYYGVSDSGKHFMFMAPADQDGNAVDSAGIIYAQCIGEKPPCDKTRPGSGKTDMFLGD